MRKNVYLRRQRDVLARQLIVTLAFVVVPLSTVHAQTATPAATPLTSTASSQITPAWLEFGTQGQLLARVVVDGDCPALEIDGHAAVMAPRAAATAGSRDTTGSMVRARSGTASGVLVGEGGAGSAKAGAAGGTASGPP